MVPYVMVKYPEKEHMYSEMRRDIRSLMILDKHLHIVIERTIIHYRQLYCQSSEGRALCSIDKSKKH